MTDLDVDWLVCPRSKRPLREVPLGEAAEALGIGRDGTLVSRASSAPPAPIGPTPTVMLGGDELAYPVVDGVPVLLAPEALTHPSARRHEDLTSPAYAEAYDEMAHYNAVAERSQADIATSPAYTALSRAMSAPPGSFPEPRAIWLDATYDCAAQADAYRAVAPQVRGGGAVAQIGGSGLHALKLLLAGADEACLLTPMLGEALFSHRLADALGFSSRFRAVVGVAEEMPFAGDRFVAMLSGGSLHHVETEPFGAELSRVLAPGGVFAAWDPWLSPLYDWGTAVFGKRENVGCRPLDRGRLAPLSDGFDGTTTLTLHSPMLRYLLLVLQKLRMPATLPTTIRAFDLEDRVTARARWLDRWSSSSAVVMHRPA